MGQNKQTKKGAGGGIAAGPQKNKKNQKPFFYFFFFFFGGGLGIGCNPRCADEPGGRPCPSDKTLCAGQGAGAPSSGPCTRSA